VDATALAEHLAGTIDEQMRDRLAEDPFSAIPACFGVPVEQVHAVTGPCSDEGDYREDPPRIRVVERDSQPRMKFTAIHELGHHLLRDDHLVVTALLDCHDVTQSVRLEETIANAFAAEILVPAARAAAVLDGRQPTAADVVNLFGKCHGSRTACCIRAAQLLRADGYVTLSRDDVLTFAASSGGSYQMGRDIPQGSEHLLARAARLGLARGVARLRHTKGSRTREYHLDALRDDSDERGWVFAVLTADQKPPWGPWGQLDPDQAPPEFTCAGCGELVETWQKCDRCEKPKCECGACGCGRRAAVETRLCTVCWLWKPASLFIGTGTECRDCTG